ncbi:hypothetical protein [Rugamonas sp.]|uniref:hypothetical protein n=1 Tax=Rugamonas sp. TaxID=1926287 RepID=UPI0025D54924|nr:hypothetical protein [Rugamonas sp.]
MYAPHIDQLHNFVDDAGAAPKPKRSRAVLYAILLAGALYAGMATLGAVAGMSPFSHVTGQDETVGAMSVFLLLCLHLMVCALGGYLVGRLGKRTHDEYNDERRAGDRSNVVKVWVAATLMMALAVSGGARAVVGDMIGFGSVSATAAALPMAAQQAGGHALAAVPVQQEQQVQASQQSQQSQQDFGVPDVIIWAAVALVLSAIAASYCATFGALQRDGMRLDLRQRELRQRELRNR